MDVVNTLIPCPAHTRPQSSPREESPHYCNSNSNPNELRRVAVIERVQLQPVGRTQSSCQNQRKRRHAQLLPGLSGAYASRYVSFRATELQSLAFVDELHPLGWLLQVRKRCEEYMTVYLQRSSPRNLRPVISVRYQPGPDSLFATYRHWINTRQPSCLNGRTNTEQTTKLHAAN